MRGVQAKNDYLEETAQYISVYRKMQLEYQAKQLQGEYFPESDQETLNRITHSIDLMSKQLMEGAEVNPSLLAPDHIKKAFPDNSKFLSSLGEIKKIESGKS